MAGIRPEHFEDADLVDPTDRDRGVTFEATVDIAEWLGSEQFAYVPFEAPPEVVEPLQQLAVELDSEAPRTQLVASLDPSSRIAPGDRARLWFDPAHLHLFDAETGESVGSPTLEGHVPEHQDPAGH